MTYCTSWVTVDLKRIAIALRHCGRVQAPKLGKSYHSHLIKSGVHHDIFIANNLISMYVDLTLLDDARKLFDDMVHRNVVTWTTMVSAYTSRGRPYEAIELYLKMLESKTDEEPNGFMYSAVLKACGYVGNVELGRLIHKRIISEKLERDTVLMNTLLDMYIKCGNFNDAREIFLDFSSANSTSWNTIISGFCKEGLMEEAVGLFHRMPEPNAVSWNSIIAGFADIGSLRALEFVCMMHQGGLRLDEFTFPCALKTCSFVGLLAMGMQIHGYVQKSGFESSYFTLSAMIDMYANCNEIKQAIKIFDQYACCNTYICDSLAIWNSMLSGYVVNECNVNAVNLLLQIYHSGVSKDSYFYSNALKVCINILNLRLGRQVHGLVVTGGYELDCVVGSILIDLYARQGNIKDAFGLFHRLPKKDIVAWSGLIMGCANMGLLLAAFSLFRDMINLNVEVDQFIISSVLKVCSSLSSLGSGKQVHALCMKRGYELEEVTLTSLIDMYSKCGEIEDGLALFLSMPKRDVVCWTGIIVGCGQNGRPKEAIKFFHDMIGSGLKPNEVTFLGVLSACRHAGLVEEAWTIFNSMKPDHGLEPHLEHYYCMVDLLGQAGCTKEAEKLIADMPFEPDKSIWGSMLEACAIHNKTNLVNVIAEHLLATSGKDPSIYVMLSNVYAKLGMWDKLSKVRETVKKLGRKEAGMSWIEI
ncbi:hypothetical protein HS088_TW11G00361 [Tripterygium wilfordii]|uniref:Pentatricopeptide repeat-containing protein n=1 Tax=Tripterygium wilfordii TaxID=458696 RepID=A0A7J7D1Q0_TRIWF|nr:pentatricopeptide repeat-containing protein At4g08210 [Tripterygium wilfordii]XP_038714946.1 pentatricopeptide repeat-containing protein At4g08210 [Tripterygium wilfordii]XP_038714947.1 pentatricopeptide repeat-containing protein At4g08210 [Tripterygium wilfordii]XP_038714948.1 pentatricopeptide repeat-containing protein At4g08210 [Tripterygium wilfordii]KAF5740295.1 hypothetical protein HS088_TW11G00361 [Tripterygium wilfordii]